MLDETDKNMKGVESCNNDVEGVSLTSLLKLMVEECCDTLLLDLEDHVEAVDGEDEVDGEGEEENHEERLED